VTRIWELRTLAVTGNRITHIAFLRSGMCKTLRSEHRKRLTALCF
jgi:hypothetical protein